jgi:hypothetical protein
MSLRVLCPNGHELLLEANLLGRKVRCPACKTVMLVSAPGQPVGAAPPPAARDAVQSAPPMPRRRPPAERAEQELEELPERADEDEDRPRARKAKGGKNRELMLRTRLGLGFHYGKALCFLIFFIALLITDLLTRIATAGARASAGAGNAGATEGFASFLFALLVGLSVFSFIATVVTAVMGFVGSLLCLWVPAKTGTKPLSITSFSLDGAGVALTVLGTILLMAAGITGGGLMGVGAAGVGGILYLLGALLVFVALALSMLFLRNLAYYLGDDRTGDECVQVMILLLAVGIGGIVVMIGLGVALAEVPKAGAVVLGILSLAWIATMIRILLRALALIATLRAQLSRSYG